MLADRSIGFPARWRAVVSLCRPGGEAFLPALTEMLLDPREDETLKQDILLRIDRAGAALPAVFRELLHGLPGGDLDFLAAAALALTDDGSAPSLLVAGLRHVDDYDDSARWLLVWAALALSGGEADVVRAAEPLSGEPALPAAEPKGPSDSASMGDVVASGTEDGDES